MTLPIEQMLAAVEWAETGAQPGGRGLPYATHSGVLRVFDTDLRCYRLNTGEAVFDADDVQQLFSGLLDD